MYYNYFFFYLQYFICYSTFIYPDKSFRKSYHLQWQYGVWQKSLGARVKSYKIKLTFACLCAFYHIMYKNGICPFPVLSPVLSCPLLSIPVFLSFSLPLLSSLSCPVLSCSVLSPVMSRHLLSHSPVLCCPVLSIPPRLQHPSVFRKLTELCVVSRVWM